MKPNLINETKIALRNCWITFKMAFMSLDTEAPDVELSTSTRDMFFTESELHFLRSVLAECICEKEMTRSFVLEDAQYYKEKGDLITAKLGFARHRKLKAHIKKLSSIQKKVKHSLVILG